MVVLAAKEGSASLPLEQRTALFTSLLRVLAEPGKKDLWLAVLRSLLAQLPADVSPSIGFFRPVADVLESGDITRLDPLPPEQREFAREVLRRFEPSEDGGAQAAQG
jgi:hypothetical protein